MSSILDGFPFIEQGVGEDLRGLVGLRLHHEISNLYDKVSFALASRPFT
jgi:hypothetical protein